MAASVVSASPREFHPSVRTGSARASDPRQDLGEAPQLEQRLRPQDQGPGQGLERQRLLQQVRLQ